MPHILTTCTFCGAGCGLYLETAANRVVGVYPSMSHPSNRGRICLRGWHVHEVASSPDRLRRPLMRRGDAFEEVSWADALGYVAARLQEIRALHGPEAVAFLNSPRCSNEETYLLQKLARAVIGTNNVDHGTGVYSNNSINVLLEMLGLPAATNAVADLDASDTIIVDDVDLGRQLPTIGGHVIRAKLNGAKLIVIDTRRHRVAESADLFLQIKPGTEAALYGAMAKVIVDHGLMDRPFIKARCAEYEAFLAAVAGHDLLAAAAECGVTAEQIEAAALAYGRAKAAAILYSTGIEARSADSIRGLVNLALLAGQLGRPGAGIFPLAEQNNLQGVCDMGMLPDRLPGYRPVSDPAARAALGKLWGKEPPATPGRDAKNAIGAGGQNGIRAVWLCRYDPVGTAFFGNAAALLDRFDLVVAQHLFLTDTARHAHVVLPTTAFGEECVSFTSTDRRIQLARQVIEPPDGPRPAWRQIAELGRMLGADWNYASAADVMAEIGRAVPFYGAATHDNLGRDYGRHWPCTADRPLGTGRLFDRETAGADGAAGTAAAMGVAGAVPGRFRFVPVAARREAVAGAAEYPFTMVFGRSLYYWHQNVLIRHSETLKREHRILLLDYPDGFVEINSEDARRLGIRDGEKVRLRGAGGAAESVVRVTPEVRAGTIHVPYFVREVESRVLGRAAGEVALVPVGIEKIAS